MGLEFSMYMWMLISTYYAIVAIIRFWKEDMNRGYIMLIISLVSLIIYKMECYYLIYII